MILINFSHPITQEQQAEIEALTNQCVETILPVSSQFSHDIPFPEQISALVDSIELSLEDWQTKQILIIPPAYNFAALTLIAELHGRLGYFPTIIRTRPVPDSTPTSYEIAEIINLQSVREQSRVNRKFSL